MRVMVAGATGAVGAGLVPLLVARGHTVIGLTRSAEKAEALKRLGAEPVVVDALDGAGVRAAALAVRPEVVVHELTALKAIDIAHFDRAFAATNRLRAEGLDVLIAAARECGARRFIAQSFCGWPYARQGGPVKTEEDPLDPSPPREFASSLNAIRHLEGTVGGERAFDGLALHYGGFYGPHSGVFDGSTVDQVRRRRLPLIGDGGGWWSFLHVDDAARPPRSRSKKARRASTTSSTMIPLPVREWAARARSNAGRKAAEAHPALARAACGGRAPRRHDD